MYTHTRTPTHTHRYTHTHLNSRACKHTRQLTRRCTLHTQTAFEGRFNHGDTHLGAVVAAWRWLWPSLDARRDEQSEHWHTSRRHVNSNQRCLSVNAPRSRQTDAGAALPLQSCRLSQNKWPKLTNILLYHLSPPAASTCCNDAVTDSEWKYNSIHGSLVGKTHSCLNGCRVRCVRQKYISIYV